MQEALHQGLGVAQLGCLVVEHYLAFGKVVVLLDAYKEVANHLCAIAPNINICLANLLYLLIFESRIYRLLSLVNDSKFFDSI